MSTPKKSIKADIIDTIGNAAVQNNNIHIHQSKTGSHTNPLETISRITGTPLEGLENLKKDLDTPGEARERLLRMASILKLAEGIMPEELIKDVLQMTKEQFKQFEQDTLKANKFAQKILENADKIPITDIQPQAPHTPKRRTERSMPCLPDSTGNTPPKTKE